MCVTLYNILRANRKQINVYLSLRCFTGARCSSCLLFLSIFLTVLQDAHEFTAQIQKSYDVLQNVQFFVFTSQTRVSALKNCKENGEEETQKGRQVSAKQL